MKDKQKQLITEVMNADAKDGLYDHVPDIGKMITPVEWLVNQLKIRGYSGEFPPHLLFEQAKQMEKEQIINAYDDGSEERYNEPVNGKHTTTKHTEANK